MKVSSYRYSRMTATISARRPSKATDSPTARPTTSADDTVVVDLDVVDTASVV